MQPLARPGPPPKATPCRRHLRVGLLCCFACLGCPQLLDDFVSVPERSRPEADASLSLGGTDASGGAAGSASLAGSAGSGAATMEGGSGGSGPGGTAGGAEDAGADRDARPPSPTAPLAAVLLHRYGFGDAGTVVRDLVGDADGQVINTAVEEGSGRVDLSPAQSPSVRQYVDLPDGLISVLESLTVEAWVDWKADPGSPQATWQSIFDFGMSNQGAGESGVGRSYLALIASSFDEGSLSAVYTENGYDERIEATVSPPLPLPPASDPERGVHVALVLDFPGCMLRLYLEGVEVARSPDDLPLRPRFIDDRNAWIGRSQFSASEFDGGIVELRIYGAALSAEEIALSHSLGPDAAIRP